MELLCTASGCPGVFEEGFCDTCGRVASAVPGSPQLAREGGYGDLMGSAATGRRPQVAAVPASFGTHRGASRGSATRRLALGCGLVQLPPTPSSDPLLLVLADPSVPAGSCLCPHCGNRVKPDKRFCSSCGAEYDFRPRLRAGDVVGEQYEVKGPIAFGGLGWIYLAMDMRLDRWVVLKGLLNTGDAAAAAAAVAERQFLAAIKHGRIVGIYSFAVRGPETYIVMEYVGGRTLHALRKDRGPLPAAEAIAVILGILPAFAFLHAQGLVYCDFKPDNFMLEGDDVKLIDLGAVRRIGDPDGDIYGTVGYQAPEAAENPDARSDLYTVGRTLAALLMDFDNVGRHERSLPAPNELMRVVPAASLQAVGIAPDSPLAASLPDGAALPPWLTFHAARRAFIGTAPPDVVALDVVIAAGSARLPLTLELPLAGNESLHRLLLRATAIEPGRRFQSADAMAAQLLGVLREIVARTRPVPTEDSSVFTGERNAPGAEPGALATAWRRLPDLRLDPEDAAVGLPAILGVADPRRRGALLDAGAAAAPASAELLLRQVDASIDSGETDVARVIDRLDRVLAIDPFDWRPDWYCGKLYLALGHAADAVPCFDRVYSDLPGETAPKVALALALETAGRQSSAAGLFAAAGRTDRALATAAFGLARCRIAAGDRAAAIAAYLDVPDHSACRAAALLVAAQMLCGASLTGPAPVEPSLTELQRASDILLGLHREDIAYFATTAALALQAARQVEAGGLTPDDGATLLGHPFRAADLRCRAEAGFRACARLADRPEARLAYVDQANAARPRTWI